MNCKHVQKFLDSFLIESPDEEQYSELVEHIVNCPRCARDYEAAVQALDSIRLSHKITVSHDLKEHIMSRILETNGKINRTAKPGFLLFKLWKPALVTGAAVILLVIGSLFFRFGNDKETDIAVNLLTDVRAAEKAVFDQTGVVHIINEIIVKPVSNPVLAQIRWFPVTSIESDGKPRFHQLKLPAEKDEGYTVDDEAWYDPSTGRFMRILSTDGTPVYANSFDGDAIYVLEEGVKRNMQVSIYPLAPDFNPPENPAEFLGIAVGLPSNLDEKEDKQVSYEGDTTLKDGSKARILKVGFGTDGPELAKSIYLLCKIREDDNTIAEMEWIAQNLSLMVVRRIRTETIDNPEVRWNLAGVETTANAAVERPGAGIQSDVVIPNVSIQHMIEKADFETYIFASSPPWTNQFEITDILDLVSQPHRAFIAAYRAEDGRHVVLNQSYSSNKMSSQLIKSCTLLYTSPNGFKVWSGSQTKWMAKIFLQSAGAVIHDPPSEDCTGYIIETPVGTFPCIAVNGKLSDGELHNLIDSFVPAREYAGK